MDAHSEQMLRCVFPASRSVDSSLWPRIKYLDSYGLLFKLPFMIPDNDLSDPSDSVVGLFMQQKSQLIHVHSR